MEHPGMMADLQPDKPAVIMADNGETVTFRQFEETSNRFANLLRASRIQRGDGLAVLLENRSEYLPLVWGGMRAGLRVTAIATHLTPEEIDYILSDSGAKVLVTSVGFAEKTGRLALDGIAVERRLMLDASQSGFSHLQQLLEGQPLVPIGDQSEGIEMLYSSGTTGRPKGIRKQLPEAPFGTLSPTYRRSVELYGIDATTRYLSPAPLYHAAPLGFNLRTLRVGGTTIIMRKFDAEQALTHIEQQGITHSQWVPTHFVRMLRLSEGIRTRYDLTTHRCAIHAAAPCPVEIKHQMIDWWGPILKEYYAGSEGNGHTSITSEEWLAHPGSVGRPNHGKVHICDEEGYPLPVGQEGTIFFEGGATFEYHNDPDKTAASRNRLGWSTLGDIGYLDEEGYLYLTDRKAHMIISGGVNIYPQEAENVLVQHPKIYDAAVIGVPNAEFGEEVKAVVHPVDMAFAGPEFEAELIAHCRAQLSPVKCPKSIDFVPELPRQENGKLYKRKLRDAYWEKNQERRA
ncbi:MAG: acyl-CoA synthetase [Hyphomicrobiaceae bacterium]